MEQLLSVAEQNYLKHIYTLQHQMGGATTQALADRMGVKPPSATAMIKHLAHDPAGPYVTHTPYRGVELTPRGEIAARELLRRLRLLERFLVEQLDMSWDQAQVEADLLEHVISGALEERITAKLAAVTNAPGQATARS